jgi:hypothetical protein
MRCRLASSVGLVVHLACAALWLPLPSGLTATTEQPSPADEGQNLAAELRDQPPAEALATQGRLRRRDPEGKWGDPLLVRMDVTPAGNGWNSIYRAFALDGKPIETLAVRHTIGRPNQYDRWTGQDVAKLGAAPTASLVGPGAALPFASSDFWLTDLGLEFLHWPQQRILKNEMRKGRSCKVLESLAPDPQAGGYARVLSWIDIEHRGLLRAEAYDAKRRLIKEFSIGNFKKVNGRWQLKSMEIRNEATDARTRLEFELEIE